MPMQARRSGRSIAPIHKKPQHYKAVNGQHYVPAAFTPPPPLKTVSHCTEGWVGLGSGLDGHGKSRPLLGFDPRTFQPVAIHCTELPWPPLIIVLKVNISRCLGKYESTFQLLKNDCGETVLEIKFQSRHLTFLSLLV
jgi:hypothetical protein